MARSTSPPAPAIVSYSRTTPHLRLRVIGVIVSLALGLSAAPPAMAGDQPGQPAIGPAPVADGANRDARAAGATLLLVLAARRAGQVKVPTDVARRPTAP